METKCFVLMFFGETPEEKVFAQATYDYFLVKIAEGLGYKSDEIDRADISGKTQASLADNYFKKIANAELVLADLSSNSASVYYELGVRHALVRKTTIILAPKTDRTGGEFKIAFDVGNDHHVYRYNPSHVVENMEGEYSRLVKEISAAIKSDAYEIDSPVFHHIDGISDFRERTQTSEQQIIDLRAENARLRKRLAKKESEESFATDEFLLIDFEAAQQEQQLYGSEILKSLRAIGTIESDIDKENREKEEEDTKAFVHTLEKMNASRFISARVFRRIARMCINRNLIAYAQRILECGLIRYPNDDDIRFDLIDLYHESESAELRIKAVRLCEEYYYIQSDGENVRFSEKSKQRPFTSNRLISLFNAYIGMDYYQRLYSITENLPKIVDLEDPRCQALLPRNKAVAEMEQGHYNKAVGLFIEAYSKDPSVRTISLLSNTCYRAGKKEVGYLLREFLAAQEPNEADSYIDLVESVRKYECIPSGVNDDGSVRFDKIGVTLRPFEKTLIPLLYRAMLCEIIDEDDQNNIINFLTDVFKTKAAQDALNFYHDSLRSPQWKSDNYSRIIENLRGTLDFTIVDRIDEKNKQMGTQGYANDEIGRIIKLIDIPE